MPVQFDPGDAEQGSPGGAEFGGSAGPGGGMSWVFDFDLGEVLAALEAGLGGPVDLGGPSEENADFAEERVPGEMPDAKSRDLIGVLADHLPAGPGLAAWLSGADPDVVSDWDLPGIAGGYRRLAAWAQARELAAVAAMTSRAAARDPRAGIAENGEPARVTAAATSEVALGLVMTQTGASWWAHLAGALRWRLPSTGAALAAGVIDVSRARLIHETTARLDEDEARAVEAMVLPTAGELTTAQLRVALRRAVIVADPEGAEDRRRDAESRSRVCLWPDDDGTATLAGYHLPGVLAAAMMARLSAMALAMKAAGYGGGLDLLRAQALAGRVLGTLDPVPPPADGPPDDPRDPDPDDSDSDGPGGSGGPDGSRGSGGPESGGSGPGGSGPGGRGPGGRGLGPCDGPGPADSGKASGSADQGGDPGDDDRRSPDDRSGSDRRDDHSSPGGPANEPGPGGHDGGRHDGPGPSHGKPNGAQPLARPPRPRLPSPRSGGGPPAGSRPDSRPPPHPPESSLSGPEPPSCDDPPGNPFSEWPPPDYAPTGLTDPGGPPGTGTTAVPNRRAPHLLGLDSTDGPGSSAWPPAWPPLPSTLPELRAPAGTTGVDADAVTKRPAGLLDLTIPWSALAGRSQAPAHLGRLGPVTASQARLLAVTAVADPSAQWRVIVTNAEGHAIAVERVRRGRVCPRQDGRPPGVVGRVTVAISASALDQPPPITGTPAGGILTAVLRAAARAVTRAARAEAAGEHAGAGCAHAGASAAYRPPRRLREFVEARDQTCRHRSCRQPAWRTDLDHTIPWHLGGPTCSCNIGGWCRTHHQVKQEPGWTLTQPRPGHFQLTTPAGRTYDTHPDTYLT